MPYRAVPGPLPFHTVSRRSVMIVGTNPPVSSFHLLMLRCLAVAATAAAVAWLPSPAVASDLEYVVLEADDPVGAVIFLHSWSQGQPADVVLAAAEEGHVEQFIVDAGWTVYVPFHGEDWGTNYGVIDEMVEVAEGDGFDMNPVRLVAVSGGTLTALNWAWRNPDDVGSVQLVTPAYDLGDLYTEDTPDPWPSVRPTLEATFGPDVAAGSAAFDPALHDVEMSVIADRVSVYASRDDEIIEWDELMVWADGLGIDVTASGAPGEPGGFHIFATYTEAWPATVAEWFAAPTSSLYPSEAELRVIVEEWREENRPDLELDPMLEVAVTFCTDETDPMILAMLIDNGELSGNVLDFLTGVCPQVINAADAAL